MEFRSYADVAAALQAESNVWAAGQGHTDAAVREQALAARAWWENYQAPQPSSPGPSYSPGPPPPAPKPPDPWIRTSSYVEGVKQADPDIVIFDEEPLSPELLIELEYEQISGVELINISRSDLINGQDVIYSPIKNLASIRRKYNPNNVIALPSTSSSTFAKYAIDLILRIGENPETGKPYEPYFNENGDLVIEIEDVREDELIEVEVDTNGTINLVDFI